MIALFSHLSFANLKLLIIVVDDSGGWAGCTGECDSLVVGGKLDGSLAGDGVRRVEAGSSGNGTEHGKVLQGHLTGTILTWRERERNREEKNQCVKNKIMYMQMIYITMVSWDYENLIISYKFKVYCRG